MFAITMGYLAIRTVIKHVKIDSKHRFVIFITDELILHYSHEICKILQSYTFIKYISAIYTERIVLLKYLKI